jgi:hypothetical protein
MKILSAILHPNLHLGPAANPQWNITPVTLKSWLIYEMSSSWEGLIINRCLREKWAN